MEVRFNPQFWILLDQQQDIFQGVDLLSDSSEFRWLQLIARLKPEVHRAAVQAALATVYHQLESDEPPEDRSELLLFPGQYSRFWPGFRDSTEVLLKIIAALAGAMLLAACLNVSNLLGVSFHQRRTEISIRRALGARAGA